ncbi:hypothetical protein HPB50_014188 [Hyalomma asiaticum]|uniref:Uncharacterized protein n=1 Tax=Hyalomma asiaticum TaxID=266040 RepID=A0ACB7RP50_HYAAI|nr:hypothetical protein HPB50_014188 [Hyalomma asiaticum]
MERPSGEGGAVGGARGRQPCFSLVQVNLDHARLSMGNLCDFMTAKNITIAAVCDPYRPRGRMPRLPEGFACIACEEDPASAFILRRPPYDICPRMVTKWVVAIFCQSRYFDFTLISVYAPPHKPMQHTLGLVEEMVVRSSSVNVVVAGDFNAKHRAWGPRAGDDRGARVMELAAATGLTVLNDPLSPPTYENTYAASWIDVTLATPAVMAAGYVWEVHDDVTFSEHKYVTVRVGNREAVPRKRLTRYAQAELLMALSRERWFDRVVGSRLGTPEALESVVDAFYRMLNNYLDRYRRPVRPGRMGNSWWSPELAQERKKVNAMRRRYQRARDESMRLIWRQEYSAAMARFRRSIREAREAYERECHSACPGEKCILRHFARHLEERVHPAYCRRLSARTLELERANAQYDLVVQRTPVSFGDISFTPDEIMPPVDVWQEHPAARMYYGYRRLTRDGARRLARAPGLHVYTDGSYSDRAAGAAFVVLGPGDRVAATGRYRVERATSAYCAEVTAMIEALHYIRDRYVTADVRVYTDCLSLLHALSRDQTADGRVYEIKTALRDIAARAKIWLYHVPGHSGVFGNELADFLASRAAVRGQTRYTLLTPRAIRAALGHQERLRWARDWTENSSDTYLFRWVPRVSEVPAWFPPNRALVTLLTGHGRFVGYFHRFNLSRDPHCACGQDFSKPWAPGIPFKGQNERLR